MKKYLLPESGNFYKANLHCHSTLSDGLLSPEEIKKVYSELGYSIVAYTDHDIFLLHNDLTDDKFLALNGFEMEINEKTASIKNGRKTCHICYVALDKEKVVQPMWNEKHLFGNAVNYKDEVKFDKTLPPYIRDYSGEAISKMMETGRTEGFFVTYNHPTWSLESYPEYMGYNNMNAFEMFNGSCLAHGFDDYNPRVYDDMLRAGKRLYCIGADDNHNVFPADDRKWDSGVAFTVIKAERLEYKAITDALVNGDFYCSEGPRIEALWLEDGKVHIECSEADRIVCNYRGRKADIVYSPEDGTVTCAEFDVCEDDGYFRLTVVDKSGKHACTNAFFTD